MPRLADGAGQQDYTIIYHGPSPNGYGHGPEYGRVEPVWRLGDHVLLWRATIPDEDREFNDQREAVRWVEAARAAAYRDGPGEPTS